MQTKSNELLVGVSKMGNPQIINPQKPQRIAICGTSGSGKSVLLQNILTQYMAKLRNDVIFGAFDPKITSLVHLEARLDILVTEPAEFLTNLQAIEIIMSQRYSALRDLQKSCFTEADLDNYPMIVVVLEEAMSIVQNDEISKDASKKIMSLYTTLFTRARAANISIIMVSHSFSAECLPTVARDQLQTRIILQTQSDTNVGMLAEPDEAPAHVNLKNPGEFYFIKSSGASPVMCKTGNSTDEENQIIAQMYSMDKHTDLIPWEVSKPQNI